MKHLFIIALAILGISIQCLSQTKGKILINPNIPEAYSKLDTKGDTIIKFKAVPEEIMLLKPDSSIASLVLYLNVGEKNRETILLFGQKSIDKSIRLDALFDKGYLLFGFLNGYLIRINDKAIDPVQITKNEIKIIVEKKPKKEIAASVSEEDPYKSLESNVPQSTIILRDKWEIRSTPLNCMLCTVSFDSCKNLAKIDSNKKEKPINTCCITSDSPYETTNSALTKLEINELTGEVLWKTRKSVNEKFIINGRPEKIKWTAGSDLFILYKGLNEPVITTDNKVYFIDSSLQASVFSQIEAARNGISGTGNNSNLTTAKDIDSIAKDMTEVKFTSRNYPGILPLELLYAQLKKQVDTNTTDISLLKKRIDSIEKMIAAAISISDTTAQLLKEKLVSLDKVLERFNFLYNQTNSGFDSYIKALAFLKQSIKTCLGLPAPDNATDFASSLIDMTKHTVPEKYYKEFSSLIKNIEVEYRKAITQKASLRTFGLTVPIPYVDQLIISIENKESKKEIYNADKLVKNGWKIDFSTGVYYSGLGSPKFDLRTFNTRYRTTRDTVVVRSGQAQDSTIYNGTVRDTSGYLIRCDARKPSFGAGFFVHAYWRSGCDVNLGAVTGIVYNTDGQLQFMLGLSPMINVGSNRISFLFGAVAGKTTKLSSVYDGNVWKKEYQDFENAGKIFESKNTLPKYTSISNSSDIKTVDKLKISYFFGISYNFKSINLSR